MLSELRLEEFKKVIPLFHEFDFSLSLLASFAGNNPGRIFVDDPINPSVAFALTVEGYFLIGDPNNSHIVTSVGDFLREQIFTGEIYLDDNTNLSLAVYPASWEDKLNEMIPSHEIEKLPRYQYICLEPALDWRAHLPSGFQVRPFDQDILQDSSMVIPEEILDWACIEIRWGSLDNYLRNGVGTCVTHGNQVIAICSPDCYIEEQIDIGIFTLPEYRRKGLAVAATAANVEAAFKKGFRQVGWHCNADNLGSIKTAEKVGFKLNERYYYYYYVFNEIDHLAELGWHYFKLGQYHKTTDYYERVFSAREDYPDYYYHLTAVAWAALENKERAINYLNAAVDHGWQAREWTEQEGLFRILHGSPQWEGIIRRMSR